MGVSRCLIQFLHNGSYREPPREGRGTFAPGQQVI
jgi:hypothetical protein